MLLLPQVPRYYFLRIAFKVLLCCCALYVLVRVLVNYGIGTGPMGTQLVLCPGRSVSLPLVCIISLNCLLCTSGVTPDGDSDV